MEEDELTLVEVTGAKPLMLETCAIEVPFVGDTDYRGSTVQYYERIPALDNYRLDNMGDFYVFVSQKDDDTRTGSCGIQYVHDKYFTQYLFEISDRNENYTNIYRCKLKQDYSYLTKGGFTWYSYDKSSSDTKNNPFRDFKMYHCYNVDDGYTTATTSTNLIPANDITVSINSRKVGWGNGEKCRIRLFQDSKCWQVSADNLSNGTYQINNFSTNSPGPVYIEVIRWSRSTFDEFEIYNRNTPIELNEWNHEYTTPRDGRTIYYYGKLDLEPIYPTISSLEPSKNLLVNADNAITVTWNADIQARYKLKIAGKTFTGTTAQTVTIGANTLPHGELQIELTVWGYEGHEDICTTKTETFIAYGTPPTPILRTSKIYSSNTPQITWSSKEQASFTLTIKDVSSGTIVESVTENSSRNGYTVKKILSANKVYSVELTVTNGMHLTSAKAVKEFRVKDPDLANATLAAYTSDNNAIALTYSVDSLTTSINVFRRIKGQEEWEEIATTINKSNYTDFEIASNVYEYKIIARTPNKGAVESNTVEVDATKYVTHFNFYNPSTKEHVKLIWEPSITTTPTKDVKLNNYAGDILPTAEIGIINYHTLQCKFMCDKETLDKFEEVTKDIVFYSDHRGVAFYGFIPSFSATYESALGIYSLSFSISEVNYNHA